MINPPRDAIAEEPAAAAFGNRKVVGIVEVRPPSVGNFLAGTLLAAPEEIHTLSGKGMRRSPKATFELVPRCEGESFNVREFKLPAFSSPWHFHPEYELTYIVNGSGSRFAGERINAVHQYVFRNFTGRIDHEEMARNAGMSASAFSRYFRRLTGRAVSETVNEVSVFDRKGVDRNADRHNSTHSIISSHEQPRRSISRSPGEMPDSRRHVPGRSRAHDPASQGRQGGGERHRQV